MNVSFQSRADPVNKFVKLCRPYLPHLFHLESPLMRSVCTTLIGGNPKAETLKTLRIEILKPLTLNPKGPHVQPFPRNPKALKPTILD